MPRTAPPSPKEGPAGRNPAAAAPKPGHGPVLDLAIETVRPSPENEQLYRRVDLVDPEIIALAKSIKNLPRRQRRRGTEYMEETTYRERNSVPSVPSVDSVLSVLSVAVLAAFGTTTTRNPAAAASRIVATVHRTSAERPWERGLFSLTRLLRGLASDKDDGMTLPSRVCRELLLAWRDLSGLELSDDLVLETFAAQWRAVRHPAGSDALAQALARARRNPPPEAAQYDEPATRFLAGLCAELQRAAGPNRPFFLSAHVAAEVLAITPMRAWRKLRLLELDGVLAVAERGTQVRATRYNWLPPIIDSGDADATR